MGGNKGGSQSILNLIWEFTITYVHWHGISPLKLEFLVSEQIKPSAAIHHTLATLFLAQSMGCWVFASMWFTLGSGHMNWPTRSWLQSTSAPSIGRSNLNAKAQNSIKKLKSIITSGFISRLNFFLLCLSNIDVYVDIFTTQTVFQLNVSIFKMIVFIIQLR